MMVVMDTNVVMTMFKRGHPNRPVFNAWAAGRLRWAVSTEILLEYEEVAARMTHPAYVALVFQTMDAVETVRPNIHRVSSSFRFHLITGDQHFDVLRGSGYKPQPVPPEEFIRRHLPG